MPALEIRPTTEADLPAVTEIYEHAVLHGTATFELIPPDLAEMTRRFRALMDGGHPYLVATLGGEVAGYAYAGAYRPRPAYRFTVENSIYLRPTSHRRGIGLRLLHRLIEHGFPFYAGGERRSATTAQPRIRHRLHDLRGRHRERTLHRVCPRL